MPVQFIVTKVDDEGEFLTLFGQPLFSGSYTQGGDPTITIVFDKGTQGVSGVSQNSAGMPVFLSGQTALHATRPAFEWNIQIDAPFIAVYVPGTAATNFKIKFQNPGTVAELATGAYPVTITGSVFNTLLLKFKKLI